MGQPASVMRSLLPQAPLLGELPDCLLSAGLVPGLWVLRGVSLVQCDGTGARPTAWQACRR